MIDELQLAKLIFFARKAKGLPVDHEIIMKELEEILKNEEQRNMQVGASR